jgi:ABC-type anion transport system duplicated permease subunit
VFLTCGFIDRDTVARTASLEIFDPGLRTIHAPTTSPYLLSGTETTAASSISGFVKIT